MQPGNEALDNQPGLFVTDLDAGDNVPQVGFPDVGTDAASATDCSQELQRAEDAFLYQCNNIAYREAPCSLL